LGYVKQGSVLRIAKQETLSKEAQAVSNQIKNEKQAKLLSGGIKVKYIPVSYAKVSELAGKLKDFTSIEGKIAFDDRTSSLVITDYGEYIDRIVELVKALDTAPMQVEIESKLVEARETFIRESGINWDINGQPFPFGDQSSTINSSLGGNIPDNGFSLDLNIGTFDIFGDLTASLAVFESDNKIKVLSQPRIVTMNKVAAEIRQTLQVPIQRAVITPTGPPIITFELLDVNLGLKVTPQITFKGDVILEVDVKRDFAGAQNVDGSRELNKRSATSTVMVKNGKTAVIGGIYQLDDGDIETGIPLLKDIPLLGNLFKQNRKEKIKSELLLFLKPKILREVDGPLVSQSSSGGSAQTYDAFEELSLDEGKRSESLDEPVEGDGFGDFGEDFDGDGFEEELDSLTF
jgi:type IV pilus assembly protein PilQ